MIRAGNEYLSLFFAQVDRYPHGGDLGIGRTASDRGLAAIWKRVRVLPLIEGKSKGIGE